MKLLILLGLFAVVSANVLFEDVMKEEFKLFKAEYKKIYKDVTEEKHRMNIFLKHKIYIAQHNRKYHQGLVSFKLGINEYADLANDEFVKIFNGYKGNRSISKNESKIKREPFKSVGTDPLPRSVDWREKGAVTPVKNQGQCGSCWAFSATGSMEGQNFLKNNKTVSLSEQNLVDCAGPYGNNGCHGGYVDAAFMYVKYNEGLNPESVYPYEAVDQECKFVRTAIGAIIDGLVDVSKGNEKKLEEAVATVGPISVAIDASHISFQLYHSGIYYEKECKSASSNLNHAVLVVGYGVDEEQGQSYWLVKNSWGTLWGEKGYTKMSKDKNNNCGIATDASYPLI